MDERPPQNLKMHINILVRDYHVLFSVSNFYTPTTGQNVFTYTPKHDRLLHCVAKALSSRFCSVCLDHNNRYACRDPFDVPAEMEKLEATGQPTIEIKTASYVCDPCERLPKFYKQFRIAGTSEPLKIATYEGDSGCPICLDPIEELDRGLAARVALGVRQQMRQSGMPEMQATVGAC